MFSSVTDNLELASTVYFAADSECFQILYCERGGIPYDNSNYQQSYYSGYVTKLPHQYPKTGKKSKMKHWTFQIPALAPETEWEFDEFQIAGDEVKIVKGTNSSAQFVTFEKLQTLYANLKTELAVIEQLCTDMEPEATVNDVIVQSSTAQVTTMETNTSSEFENLHLDSPLTNEFVSPFSIQPADNPPISGITLPSQSQSGWVSTNETALVTMTYQKSPALSTRSRIAPKVTQLINLDNESLTEDENAMDYTTAMNDVKEKNPTQTLNKVTEDLLSVAFFDKQTNKWFSVPTKVKKLPTVANNEMETKIRSI